MSIKDRYPAALMNTFGPPKLALVRGEGDLWLAGEEVGDVAKGLQLGGDRLDQGRMGVAQGVDGDAAEEVDVLVAVGVPDVRPLAAGQHQLGRAERIHQRVGVPLLVVRHD